MAIAALLRLGAAVAAIAGVAWQWKRPKLCDASRKYDVIVVGGGVMGVWSAIAAKRRCKAVCLLEQYDAGHRHGSSHGDGRIYRFAYQEELYVDMMNLSLVDCTAHAVDLTAYGSSVSGIRFSKLFQREQLL